MAKTDIDRARDVMNRILPNEARVTLSLSVDVRDLAHWPLATATAFLTGFALCARAATATLPEEPTRG